MRWTQAQANRSPGVLPVSLDEDPLNRVKIDEAAHLAQDDVRNLLKGQRSRRTARKAIRRCRVYQEDPEPSLALFGDLRALASILLRRVPERLTGFVPPEILASHQQPLPARRRSFDPTEDSRPGRLARSGPRRPPSPSVRPSTSWANPMLPTAYAPASQELRTLLRTFETDLTPVLVSQLEVHAGEFLDRQGIRDEPVTWQPPTDIIDDLQLPGCDLRDIDLGILHRIIRDECMTTARAARRLGVSHDAVRFVLQEQPAPPTRSAKWERGETVRRAGAAFPRDKFARFYLDEYRTLKWIAEHADVSVDAIKRLVSEYGMTRDGKASRWRQIDLDWLCDQRAAGRPCRETDPLGTTTALHWGEVQRRSELSRAAGRPRKRGGAGQVIAGDLHPLNRPPRPSSKSRPD